MLRNQKLPLWILGLASALLALATLMVPTLVAGGGDEGCDILPRCNGSAGGGGYGAGNGQITVFSRKPYELHTAVDILDTGLVLDGHRLVDLVQDNEADVTQHWADFQLTVKRPRVLEAAESYGQLRVAGSFHLAELRTVREPRIELRTSIETTAVQILIVGRRSTRRGDIQDSFSEIEWTTTEPLALPSVDLMDLRRWAQENLPNTGLSVAVGVIGTGEGGVVEEAWASFDVDDSQLLLDVQTDL